MPLPALPPPGFAELSAEEQMDYIGALWDLLVAQPEDVPVPDWQRTLLAERLAAHRRGESSSRPWPEVRDELGRRLRAISG